MNDQKLYLTRFALDRDLLEEWLETFPPSTKTFAAHFVINILRDYMYDYDAIHDSNDKLISNILCDHFFAFMKLKFLNMDTPRTLLGIAFPE